MPIGIPISEETVRFIVKNYANMSNKELCSHCGLSKSSIDRIAGVYHLRKTKEHYHKMAVKAGKASSISRGGKALNITDDVIRKRAETYKKTFQTEEMRYKWGLGQKTRIRLKKEPRRIRDQRLALIKRGYIVDNEKKIAYWTEETKRSTRLERLKRGDTSHYFRTYFDFMPWTG